MANSIDLRVINRSNDVNNTSYVIFQKNVVTSFDEIAIAWKLIQNMGQNEFHPFKYDFQVQVSGGDSWGNFTFPQDAQNGQRFKMIKSTSGDVLELDDTPASSPNEIEVLNDLPEGAISANIYRSGNLVAKLTTIAPGQKAVFEFKPIIYIGAASQVKEGEILTSAIISNINTEISLIGIASADIVIHGGGAGPDAEPFTFTLENVKYA